MAEHKTFHVLDALEASPARTRRTWSQSAKDLVLAEANVPGANVSAVARAHDVSVQQVFRWRREAQRTGEIALSGKTTARPVLSFIEMAPETKTEPAAPIPIEVCEICVAAVILRVGSSVPVQRVVELIRAARLA